MRSLLQRCTLAIAVVVGLLGTRPATATAQKALVYCPVSIDPTGCNAVVAALTGPAYPLGVDRGYDGTDGTVDLKAVDLFSYSVFVVPSLADDSTSQPYAKLRDPEVAEHLKAALIGRLAMWSGTPDQGATNRAMKDALIQNLAAWAGGAFATAKGPGLVALLDASASVVSRYDWVRAITPVPVTSDPALLIYNSVRALTQRATTILTSGAGAIAYSNMATFGFQLPNGAPGVNLDAVGQTGTSQGGQVVLLTMEAGNASGATVKTDKDDYPPGTTVVITGLGWEPNETVKLTLHMDPLRDSDTELTATADASGNITNTDFAPKEYDIGVRFVLTAVGQTSGKRAQTTFTDGQQDITGTVKSNAAGNPVIVGATVSCGNVTGDGCNNVTTSTTGATGVYTLSKVNFNGNSATVIVRASAPGFITADSSVLVSNSGGPATRNFILRAGVATTTTLTSSANPSVFGQPVTFTATVTSTPTNPQCGTVDFKDNGTTVTTVTLSGTNVATFVTSGLAVATHPMTAVYTAGPSPCEFLSSTSNSVSQVVNKASTTTTLTSSPNPSAVSQSVTFTATIAAASPGTGSPTGTVDFKEGGATLAGNVAITTVAGVQTATFSTSTLTLGTHNITAIYSGSTSFLTSTSTQVAQVVISPATTTTLVSSMNPSVFGQGVTFTATVTGATNPQCGTVTFKDGSTVINVVTLSGTNVATYLTSALTVATHSITAAYTPAASGCNFSASTSGAVAQVVNQAATTTTLASSLNPSVFGQSVTFTATVAVVSPGAGLPTGNVDFKEGATTLGSGTLTTVSGVQTATFSTTTLTVATHNITATYVASTSFASSTSAQVAQVVNPIPTTLTVDPATGTYGGTVDLKAKLMNGSTPLVGKTITFTLNGTACGDAVTDANGEAKLLAVSLAGINAGSYPAGASSGVRASFTGELTLAASNGSNTLTVNKRAATWTTNPASKTYGDADPSPLTTGTGTFLAADNVTATYSRAAGETVAGSPYAITATLSAAAGVLANYTITNAGAGFTINKRMASVTPATASKTYGDADPALTGTLTNFVAADGVTASYSRTVGETVAGSPYTISATLSPAAVLTNYTITYNTAAFTITKRAASVTPAASGKTYGDADPVLSGTLTNFVAADGVAATYSRAAGETVAGSPYTISATLAPAGVLGNYDITYNTAAFNIAKRSASVTPAAAGKTYGDADPALTGTLTNFAAADGVTASYSRTVGETVAGSPYTISATLSPVGVLGNYDITYNTAAFTIGKRSATWTTQPASKTYGDADPSPLTTGSGTFLAADNVTATYSRAAGETVAGSPYAITATLSAAAGVLANYTITNAGAAFTINKRVASVTPATASKTYGDADPALTGTLTNFVAGDNVTATYSRTAGETVAGSPYAISATLTPAGVLANYDITYNTASFTIGKRAATWTTNPASKTYGDADPSPLTTGTGSNFVAADNVTATYSRVAGETVAGSPYAITAALNAAAGVLDNYTITNAGAGFTINKRQASVTPAANSKTYGDADPTLTGTLTNFVAADGIAATYSRTAGETVGGSPYAISATLTPAGVLANYDITYNTASFTIGKRAATWTTQAASKTYGDADPTPVTTGSGSNFVAADNVTATYSRAAGESVAGSPYAISATLSAAAGALANYTITNAGAEFTINKRMASVTPAVASKTYGDADPALTGTLTNFVAADGVMASYSRTAGETVAGSPYAISATLTPAGVLANYDITYNTAAFTINKRTASVTPAAKSKTYGDADPALTGTLTNFVAADGVAATYSRTAGETVAGSPYTISATLAPAGVLGNYDITYNTAAFTIDKRAATWTTNPNGKTYGDADPSPLTTGSGNNFVAADNVTASYSRAAGETVAGGPYHITATLGPMAVLDNYTITNTGADFTITKRSASWTTQPASKTYGDDDPNPLTTGSGTNFVSSDGVTATYSRAAGETVAGSPYHITAALAPAGVLDNYTIANAGADFTINKRQASVTPAAAGKTYGDADPVLTGALSNFVAADGVAASYSRTAGETVAGSPYTISATLAPAGVLGNYDITYNTAAFTIGKRAATWTTQPASKTYGDDDPNPLTTGSGSNFVASDNVTATYGRAAGETVAGGPYHITATLGPMAVLSNYTITNAGADFTITKRSASWTTQPASKTYGDVDPSPLTTGSGSNFVAADNVTATYSRAAGETVAASPYHITAALAPAGVLDNYSITNAGADFTINKRQASVTPAAAGKTYGDADPVLTGALSNFVAADGVAASYSRTAGETVAGSPYTISATLAPAGVLGNYDITYNTAAFNIGKRTASVTPAAAGKTYGDADPALTGALSNFVAADGVTATYSRTAGETVAGSPYTISATLSPAGVLGNYTITYNTAAFNIGKRTATWTTNPNGKTYGDPEPNPLTTGSGSNFVAADNVTATYSRVAGETVSGGPYLITATLGPVAVLANYTITNTGANFTINKATPAVVWANPADIIWAAPLTSTQLNAVVNGVNAASSPLPGAKTYTPAVNTVLTPGANQSLLMQFVPTDVANYNNASKTVYINVLDKTAPIVSSTTVTPNPVAMGTSSVTLTATISDATTGGSKITGACYKIDGGACTPVNGFAQQVTVNVSANIPIPNVADVIEVCVYATDAGGNTNTKMDCALIAVYDPSAGFVTGGGWINSPAGAYVANPGLTGKATFGFVSKYKKGQTIPDGNTEFQFEAAGFNFKSTSYEWLVVAGTKAQYKGSGTINGSGDYFFMLTAIDADVKGKGPDTFRMKVWNKTTLAVIYDNQIGLSDSADPTMSLGGGSIQIHQ